MSESRSDFGSPHVPSWHWPSASLYVHVPFCAVKCRYCDFYSVAGEDHQAERYLSALEAEAVASVESCMRLGVDLRPRTVFWGGGTPTRLTARQLARLGRILQRVFDLSAVVEWTVEANPATVDADKAETLRALGVNRLSFGAQSFRDDELELLGREHRAGPIADGVALARSAGFTEVNLDMIFGLPGQSLSDWLANLRSALALHPDHLACYCLTYEPGTEMTRRLRRGELPSPDPQLEREMFYATREELTAAGYQHYEISNYARPGRECRHNLVYWRNLPYLGLGPSAVSYLAGERRKNVVHLQRWMDSVLREGWPAPASRERLTGLAAAGETAMLGLRLAEGIRMDEFRARHGRDPRELFAEPIRRFVELGLLDADDHCIRVSPAGLFVSDGIAEEFLLDDAPASGLAPLAPERNDPRRAGLIELPLRP